MVVDYLSNHPQMAPQVGRWMHGEFFDGGVPGGIRPGHTVADVEAMFADANTDAFPIRWVALEGGECLGAVSLVENDLQGSALTPWLAGLYVVPQGRRGGVGRALIEAVKDKARQMGYAKLYLRTEFAGGYYRKLGWQSEASDITDQYGLKPEVFSWAL